MVLEEERKRLEQNIVDCESPEGPAQEWFFEEV